MQTDKELMNANIAGMVVSLRAILNLFEDPDSLTVGLALALAETKCGYQPEHADQIGGRMREAWDRMDADIEAELANT